MKEDENKMEAHEANESPDKNSAHKDKKKSESSFDKLQPEEYALIAATIILALVYFVHTSQYQQIPSPVFGGDMYRDRGFVQNIVAGNPIWADGFYANEIQYYGYLVPTIQAGIVFVTRLPVDMVFLYFPILTFLISTWVWYLLGLAMFKSRRWASLTGLAYIALGFTLIPSNSSVANYLLLPAFFYSWLRYEQDGKIKHSLLAGLFLGLTSLTYGGLFLSGCLFLALGVLFLFAKELYEKRKPVETVVGFVKKYYVMALVILLVSLVFFLPLIIKYQLHQVNEVPKWGDAKIEFWDAAWLFGAVKSVFIFSKNWILVLSGLIALLGFGVLASSKKNKQSTFLLVMFASSIIIVGHQIITRPLFNLYFWPIKLLYMTPFTVLFFVAGIMFINQVLKKDAYRTALIVIAVALLMACAGTRYAEFRNSSWVESGMQDRTYINSLYGLAGFLDDNMAKDETVLSNDETGFMLAVLSGRKVVLTRRTHASYFVDIDQRIADVSVAMYGSDVNKSIDVLKKYNVKYLYVDQNIMTYPMRVRPDLAGYLEANNVNFSRAYERYDIAVPYEKATLLDLLIIPPQPLNPEFLALWKRVYAVQVQGQTIGELYELNQSAIASQTS